MTNPYYNTTGNPSPGASGLSSIVRAEFAAIAAGFALLPTISGNASKAVIINAGATALAVTAGTLALGGNFSTAGAFTTVGAHDTTFVQNASVTIGLPAVSGTLATLAGTESLSNKTLVAPALGTPASGVMTNVTGTASGLTAGHATVATSLSGGSVSATTISASGAVTLTAAGTALSVSHDATISGDLIVLGSINAAAGTDSPVTSNSYFLLGSVISTPIVGLTTFAIYMDLADNKLKAKGPSGTITVLANP